VSNYLKIIEKAKTTKTNELRPTAPNEQAEGATKATEATKVPALSGVRKETRRDKSDISDQRGDARALTLREVLAEINHQGSGPAKNAELYRRGELSEDKAVEYVTCAILRRRGVGFEGWRVHALTVRAALTHGVGCECGVCG
jgi:hypothetical protein